MEKELPAGWVWATLDDLAAAEPRAITDGPFGSNLKSAHYTSSGARVLRLQNVGDGEFRDELAYISMEHFNTLRNHEVLPGDLILASLGEVLPRVALVPDLKCPAIVKADVIRARIHESVSAKWVLNTLLSPRTRNHTLSRIKGVGRPRLGLGEIRKLPIPLPPLAEQHRIVEALEDHLSRLDAGRRTLENDLKRIASLRKSILLDLVPEKAPASWELTTVEKAGKIELGRARHPDWHHGPEMRPYLRVANVFEDRIDTADVMEMDFSGIFEKYRLKPGDILLNEGQSPHLVGRPALYKGTPPDVAFTNSLLRFQARSDVLPEWALLVFRRHLHARRFMREVRITTNIAHLSAKRLKPVEFPIPPMEEQKHLVQRSEELFSGVDALEKAVTLGLKRADHLRRSILDHAFSGRLVAQDPTDEPATKLLARIQAERAAQTKPNRVRRATTNQPTSANTPPPPAAHPLPQTAVQQEFEL